MRIRIEIYISPDEISSIQEELKEGFGITITKKQALKVIKIGYQYRGNCFLIEPTIIGSVDSDVALWSNVEDFKKELNIK